MSHLALYLLGPPRIERDGRPVDIRRRKAVALLAYLAVTRQSHSRDALATLLWPEHDQSRARAGLRRALASLKKGLGEGWLEVDRECVELNHEAEVWLDVAKFQERLAACGSHDHPAEEVCPDCLPLLAEAADLYRDDFLAGFTLRDSPAFDEWQFFQCHGLRAGLAGGLERLAQAHGEQGEVQPAIAYARRWLALDPLHEPAQRCLMELYAQSDQRAAALRQYQECERILQEELGVPPEEETTRLYQAIKEHREGAPAEPQPERYRLERKISGKGSFGDLWLATDTLLERPVAVKCPKVTDNPILRERFLTEARMLARLNHPNITQIHDALFDEGADRFYLVMEYVDGRDLSEIIGAGTPLPLDIILEVAMGILRALSYAHEQGVVHRDVKPANVMIADEVKLTDFGLADLRSILEQDTRFLAGTPAYIAPEQIEGRAVDGRADLYAVGVMLFEMLSGGRLPFEYADELEMMDAHLRAAPPPVSQFAPEVPPMLEQVIVRLLAKDPSERYPSAEAVIGVLESIHAGPRLDNLPMAVDRFTTSISSEGLVGKQHVPGQPTPVVERENIVGQILSPKAAVVLLAFLSIVTVSVFYLYPSAQKPSRMTGDFNIAIAQFGEVTDQGIVASAQATQISSLLFDFLDSEYKATDFGLDVHVTHRRIGILVEDREAEQLADAINADIVIYGRVFVGTDEAMFSPRFYVVDRPDTRELTGQHHLAFPIRFSSLDELHNELSSRVATLVFFTQGLVYLTAEELDGASGSFQEAVRRAEMIEVMQGDSFGGQEVLYLFAAVTNSLQGNMERAAEQIDQALAINPEYARAYIARGNMYYTQALPTWDRAKLQQALSEYQRSLQASDHPPGAYIIEKANTSIGNVYVVLAQQTDDPESYDRAIQHYAQVVNRYERTEDLTIKERIRGIAAVAYFGLGAAFERQKDYSQAQNAYQRSIDLANDTELDSGMAELKSRAEIQLSLIENRD